MTATIHHLDAYRRAAPAATDRLIALGNEQWARIIPAASYVPLLGRVNDEARPFEMQLED